jgi:hypothetical protein
MDAYHGSKDQSSKKRNRTSQVRELIVKNFPLCSIIQQDKNLGIAKSMFLAQDLAHQINPLGFSIILEEDHQFNSKYVSTMQKLIESVAEWSEIVFISANAHTYLNLERGQESLYPAYGQQGYAFRGSFSPVIRPLQERYVNAIEPRPYYQRDYMSIYDAFSAEGYVPPNSHYDTFQDWAISHLGKLSVTYGRAFSFNFSPSGEGDMGNSIFHNLYFIFRRNFLGKASAPNIAATDLDSVNLHSLNREFIDLLLKESQLNQVLAQVRVARKSDILQRHRPANSVLLKQFLVRILVPSKIKENVEFSWTRARIEDVI